MGSQLKLNFNFDDIRTNFNLLVFQDDCAVTMLDRTRTEQN